MRHTLRAILLGGLLCLSSAASAQGFAAKPLRIVVPYSAGGTADVIPRILAEKLQPHFPKGVVVENRTGGGANIGADFVYKSEPDGYTLLASPPGPLAVNHSLYPKLPYEPLRFVPVTIMAQAPNVLAVRSTLPAQSVAELIAMAKAKVGGVSYASQGSGSTSHLTAELFEMVAGIKLLHVPYKGTAPALTDLAGGQVDLFFDNVGSAAPLHKAGKIRILAVADARRSAVLPDVPTFAELGLPEMQAVTWFGVAAPPGTAVETVRELNRLFVDALRAPDAQAKIEAKGTAVVANSPEEMAKLVREDAARWAKVIREAKVTLE